MNSLSISLSIIRRLHEHRCWANAKLIDAAQQLSTSQLHQAFQIGQGSIWKTLTHLYAAEFVWLEALQGNNEPLAPGDAAGKIPGNQEAKDAIPSLPELQRHWGDLDRRWAAYLAELQEDELENQVIKVNSLSGQRAACKLVDVLLHVCTHAQYTTAQLNNMLRQAGVERLPDPMLISMARQQFQPSE